MIDIQFDMIPTTDQLKQWIEYVEREVMSDLNTFWVNYARRSIQDEVKRVFATEGDGTWSPLSPRYAAQKARTHPGKTILRRTDAYYKAAIYTGNAGNVFEHSADEMRWGVDLGAFPSPYPLFHEIGTSRMPARQVWLLLSVSEQLDANLVAALGRYLKKEIEERARKVFPQ